MTRSARREVPQSSFAVVPLLQLRVEQGGRNEELRIEKPQARLHWLNVPAAPTFLYAATHAPASPSASSSETASLTEFRGSIDFSTFLASRAAACNSLFCLRSRSWASAQ